VESQRFYLRAAAILGALAVLLGAFGAHGLKSVLGADTTAVYETAVRYHFYHALAILAVAVAADRFSSGAWWRWACRAWVAGVILFSGSLYLLVVSGIKWLGAVTPVGGSVLIAGWICLVVAASGYAGRGPAT
jgi:uncharacterized membrane protein YgdD (TMEM256/DUF423 family)